MLGTLVINELPYPVTGIRLGSGRIFFTAQRQSPPDGELVVGDGDQAVLLAPDGTEVFHCLLTGLGATFRARKGGWMTVELPAAIEIEGDAAWPKRLAGTDRLV